jgi:UDP-N-acetylglucosamine:LPS N-acetylglucosamine transferase
MRIMILTAATGGGHIRAAGAIESYIKNNTDYEVAVVDTLKTIGRVVDKTICDSYLFMARKAPSVFGTLYRQTNKDNRFADIIPKLVSALSYPLTKAVKEYNPDVIITTHPFSTEMISALKRNGRIDVPLICLITDYGLHRAWIANEVDAYVTACEDMTEEMKAIGVSESRIYPFGIPVYDVFFEEKNREELKEEIGLDSDMPVITFMAGSFGVSNIMKLYQKLSEYNTPMQIVVITGKNKKLFDAFEKEIEENENLVVPTKLVFFTNEVEKYMHVADLLVTKPGGLTVSEALASNLPLAVFDAIPGQEEDNANFIVKNRMGVRIGKEDDFAGIISAMIADNQTLNEMREKCVGFDKSESCENILSLARELTGKE